MWVVVVVAVAAVVLVVVVVIMMCAGAGSGRFVPGVADFCPALERWQGWVTVCVCARALHGK